VVSLPFGQMKRHTHSGRMPYGDRCCACGVKTSAFNERLLKEWWAFCSKVFRYGQLGMKRADLEMACRVRRRVGQPALLSAIMLACLLAGGAHHRVQASGTDLNAPAARLILAGDTAQRLRQLPDVFQGMMVPGFQRGQECKAPPQIRRRLKRQGWWDFSGLQRSGDDFLIRARRPNGIAYQLKIDGCSGRVLQAIRLDGGRRGYGLWPR